MTTVAVVGSLFILMVIRSPSPTCAVGGVMVAAVGAGLVIRGIGGSIVGGLVDILIHDPPPPWRILPAADVNHGGRDCRGGGCGRRCGGRSRCSPSRGRRPACYAGCYACSISSKALIKILAMKMATLNLFGLSSLLPLFFTPLAFDSSVNLLSPFPLSLVAVVTFAFESLPSMWAAK